MPNSDLSPEMIDALKKRYPLVHPLMFARSVDKAKNATELFDILEGIDHFYPMVWDEQSRSWVQSDDLLQSMFSK